MKCDEDSWIYSSGHAASEFHPRQRMYEQEEEQEIDFSHDESSYCSSLASNTTNTEVGKIDGTILEIINKVFQEMIAGVSISSILVDLDSFGLSKEDCLNVGVMSILKYCQTKDFLKSSKCVEEVCM